MTAELLLAGTGLFICLLLLLFYLPQRNFVFSPSYYPNRAWFRKRPEKYQLRQLPVAQNISLEYVTCTPQHPTHTILYFGGKDQDSVGLIQKLSEEYPSVRWVGFNYRGYGKSQGRATEKTVLADSLLMFDLVEQQYGATCLMGFSLGSSVASYVASRRLPSWIVLVAPFDSVTSLIQAKAPFLPAVCIRYTFPTLDFVQKIQCPVYVYNSTNDEIVAPHHVARLRNHIPLLKGNREFSGYSHDGLLLSPELKKELSLLLAA